MDVCVCVCVCVCVRACVCVHGCHMYICRISMCLKEELAYITDK